MKIEKNKKLSNVWKLFLKLETNLQLSMRKLKIRKIC